eukprot:TRINITY_DN4492_c0_g2_i2.p2 TRINITY_DN4492_c0_g2~~TRINITY_DN4492_c0_g2_i2.p2  ORF type:complete len:273 (-),score=50.49 TRINITY_DN4492_c0_g2_i2:199-1017(-)
MTTQGLTKQQRSEVEEIAAGLIKAFQASIQSEFKQLTDLLHETKVQGNAKSRPQTSKLFNDGSVNKRRRNRQSAHEGREVGTAGRKGREADKKSGARIGKDGLKSKCDGNKKGTTLVSVVKCEKIKADANKEPIHTEKTKSIKLKEKAAALDTKKKEVDKEIVENSKAQKKEPARIDLIAKTNSKVPKKMKEIQKKVASTKSGNSRKVTTPEISKARSKARKLYKIPEKIKVKEQSEDKSTPNKNGKQKAIQEHELAKKNLTPTKLKKLPLE